MEHPNISTIIEHSHSKHAYNVLCTNLGGKHKIARVPYVFIDSNDALTEANKNEALRHANFISFCFNNPNRISFNQ